MLPYRAIAGQIKTTHSLNFLMFLLIALEVIGLCDTVTLISCEINPNLQQIWTLKG
jgi:hypothetical protein